VKVILDANALMMPAQFQVDLFDEIRGLVGAFEPVVLAGVVHELTGLSRANGRDGAAARCGLALISRCSVVEPGDEKFVPVDEQLVEYAAQNDCLVVTNDRRVREALFARGIGVISMRGRKKLELLRR